MHRFHGDVGRFHVAVSSFDCRAVYRRHCGHGGGDQPAVCRSGIPDIRWPAGGDGGRAARLQGYARADVDDGIGVLAARHAGRDPVRAGAGQGAGQYLGRADHWPCGGQHPAQPAVPRRAAAACDSRCCAGGIISANQAATDGADGHARRA